MSDDTQKKPRDTTKIARILWLVAGGLSLTAAVIGYVDDRKINYPAIAAGIFAMLMSLTVGKRR